MVAGIVIACAALLLAILAFLFVIRIDPADLAPHRSRLDQLFERRDTIYENLRDLKFEHRAGKFSESDFEQTRQLLEREAARVLAEIEILTGSAPSVTTRRTRASEMK
ncbi:MAG TPA: hypothetical protein VNJ12_11580 [Candidatus Dormibacteraeota bacterium]|nr:hypothetical protein [Candidatus Dormibacteraeota bacterium]